MFVEYLENVFKLKILQDEEEIDYKRPKIDVVVKLRRQQRLGQDLWKVRPAIGDKKNRI